MSDAIAETGSAICGARDIRGAYVGEDVAAGYVDRRFKEPLGALLHQAQARLLLDAIARERPARILEIAPGPARLSTAVAEAFHGRLVLVDSSHAMLVEARRRLASIRRNQSCLLRGDAFALPARGPFDLAYSFRLVRHFDEDGRRRLYGQIAAVLRSGGVFVFDAVNRASADRVRAGAAPGQYPIYDALVEPDGLRRELDAAGFDLVSLAGVQKRYGALFTLQVLVAPRSRRLALAAMRALERCPGGQPLEWVVTCRKR